MSRPPGVCSRGTLLGVTATNATALVALGDTEEDALRVGVGDVELLPDGDPVALDDDVGDDVDVAVQLGDGLSVGLVVAACV